MTSLSHSGLNNWQEIVFFGIRLLETQYSELHLRNNIGVSPIPENITVTKTDLSRDALLRVAFNRIYYGILQILIDHLKIDRAAKSNVIHIAIRDSLKDPKIKQNFKFLLELRFWADYEPLPLEDRYSDIAASNIVPQFANRITILMQNLIQQHILN